MRKNQQDEKRGMNTTHLQESAMSSRVEKEKNIERERKITRDSKNKHI